MVLAPAAVCVDPVFRLDHHPVAWHQRRADDVWQFLNLNWHGIDVDSISHLIGMKTGEICDGSKVTICHTHEKFGGITAQDLVFRFPHSSQFEIERFASLSAYFDP
jgi:hypothetical protein